MSSKKKQPSKKPSELPSKLGKPTGPSKSTGKPIITTIAPTGFPDFGRTKYTVDDGRGGTEDIAPESHYYIDYIMVNFDRQIRTLLNLNSTIVSNPKFKELMEMMVNSKNNILRARSGSNENAYACDATGNIYSIDDKKTILDAKGKPIIINFKYSSFSSKLKTDESIYQQLLVRKTGSVVGNFSWTSTGPQYKGNNIEIYDAYFQPFPEAKYVPANGEAINLFDSITTRIKEINETPSVSYNDETDILKQKITNAIFDINKTAISLPANANYSEAVTISGGVEKEIMNFMLPQIVNITAAVGVISTFPKNNTIHYDYLNFQISDIPTLVTKQSGEPTGLQPVKQIGKIGQIQSNVIEPTLSNTTIAQLTPITVGIESPVVSGNKVDVNNVLNKLIDFINQKRVVTQSENLDNFENLVLNARLYQDPVDDSLNAKYLTADQINQLEKSLRDENDEYIVRLSTDTNNSKGKQYEKFSKVTFGETIDEGSEDDAEAEDGDSEEESEIKPVQQGIPLKPYIPQQQQQQQPKPVPQPIVPQQQPKPVPEGIPLKPYIPQQQPKPVPQQPILPQSQQTNKAASLFGAYYKFQQGGSPFVDDIINEYYKLDEFFDVNLNDLFERNMLLINLSEMYQVSLKSPGDFNAAKTFFDSQLNLMTQNIRDYLNALTTYFKGSSGSTANISQAMAAVNASISNLTDPKEPGLSMLTGTNFYESTKGNLSRFWKLFNEISVNNIPAMTKDQLIDLQANVIDELQKIYSSKSSLDNLKNLIDNFKGRSNDILNELSKQINKNTSLMSLLIEKMLRSIELANAFFNVNNSYDSLQKKAYDDLINLHEQITDPVLLEDYQNNEFTSSTQDKLNKIKSNIETITKTQSQYQDYLTQEKDYNVIKYMISYAIYFRDNILLPLTATPNQEILFVLLHENNIIIPTYYNSIYPFLYLSADSMTKYVASLDPNDRAVPWIANWIKTNVKTNADLLQFINDNKTAIDAKIATKIVNMPNNINPYYELLLRTAQYWDTIVHSIMIVINPNNPPEDLTDRVNYYQGIMLSRELDDKDYEVKPEPNMKFLRELVTINVRSNNIIMLLNDLIKWNLTTRKPLTIDYDSNVDFIKGESSTDSGIVYPDVVGNIDVQTNPQYQIRADEATIYVDNVPEFLNVSFYPSDYTWTALASSYLDIDRLLTFVELVNLSSKSAKLLLQLVFSYQDTDLNEPLDFSNENYDLNGTVTDDYITALKYEINKGLSTILNVYQLVSDNPILNKIYVNPVPIIESYQKLTNADPRYVLKLRTLYNWIQNYAWAIISINFHFIGQIYPKLKPFIVEISEYEVSDMGVNIRTEIAKIDFPTDYLTTTAGNLTALSTNLNRNLEDIEPEILNQYYLYKAYDGSLTIYGVNYQTTVTARDLFDNIRIYQEEFITLSHEIANAIKQNVSIEPKKIPPEIRAVITSATATTATDQQLLFDNSLNFTPAADKNILEEEPFYAGVMKQALNDNDIPMFRRGLLTFLYITLTKATYEKLKGIEEEIRTDLQNNFSKDDVKTIRSLMLPDRINGLIPPYYYRILEIKRFKYSKNPTAQLISKDSVKNAHTFKIESMNVYLEKAYQIINQYIRQERINEDYLAQGVNAKNDSIRIIKSLERRATKLNTIHIQTSSVIYSSNLPITDATAMNQHATLMVLMYQKFQNLMTKSLLSIIKYKQQWELANIQDVAFRVVSVYKEGPFSGNFPHYVTISLGIIDYYAEIIRQLLICLSQPEEQMNVIEKYLYRYHFISLNRIYKLFQWIRGTYRPYILAQNPRNIENEIRIESTGGDVRSVFDEFNLIRPLIDDYSGIFSDKVSIHMYINDYGPPNKGVIQDATNPDYDMDSKVFSITPGDPNKLNIVFNNLRNKNGEHDESFIDKVKDQNPSLLRGSMLLSNVYHRKYYPQPSVISNYMSLPNNLKNQKGIIMMTYGYSGTGKTRNLFGDKNANVDGILQSTMAALDTDDEIYLRVFEIYGLGSQYDFYWNQTINPGTTKLKFPPHIDLKVLHYDIDTAGDLTSETRTVIQNYKYIYDYILAMADPERGIVLSEDNIEQQIYFPVKRDQIKNFSTLTTAIDDMRENQGIDINLGPFTHKGIAQVKPTINNDKSSRSILVYDFEIKSVKEGVTTYTPFVIYDLPGKEDLFRTYVNPDMVNVPEIRINAIKEHGTAINDVPGDILNRPLQKSTFVSNPIFSGVFDENWKKVRDVIVKFDDRINDQPYRELMQNIKASSIFGVNNTLFSSKDTKFAEYTTNFKTTTANFNTLYKNPENIQSFVDLFAESNFANLTQLIESAGLLEPLVATIPGLKSQDVTNIINNAVGSTVSILVIKELIKLGLYPIVIEMINKITGWNHRAIYLFFEAYFINENVVGLLQYLANILNERNEEQAIFPSQNKNNWTENDFMNLFMSFFMPYRLAITRLAQDKNAPTRFDIPTLKVDLNNISSVEKSELIALGMRADATFYYNNIQFTSIQNLLNTAIYFNNVGSYNSNQIFRDNKRSYQPEVTVVDPFTGNDVELRNQPLIQDFIEPYRKKVSYYYVFYVVSNTDSDLKAEEQIKLLNNSVRFIESLSINTKNTSKCGNKSIPKLTVKPAEIPSKTESIETTPFNMDGAGELYYTNVYMIKDWKNIPRNTEQDLTLTGPKNKSNPKDAENFDRNIKIIVNKMKKNDFGTTRFIQFTPIKRVIDDSLDKETLSLIYSIGKVPDFDEFVLEEDGQSLTHFYDATELYDGWNGQLIDRTIIKDSGTNFVFPLTINVKAEATTVTRTVTIPPRFIIKSDTEFKVAFEINGNEFKYFATSFTLVKGSELSVFLVENYDYEFVILQGHPFRTIANKIIGTWITDQKHKLILEIDKNGNIPFKSFPEWNPGKIIYRMENNLPNPLTAEYINKSDKPFTGILDKAIINQVYSNKSFFHTRGVSLADNYVVYSMQLSYSDKKKRYPKKIYDDIDWYQNQMINMRNKIIISVSYVSITVEEISKINREKAKFGIINSGNTCFANGYIQNIYNLPILREEQIRENTYLGEIMSIMKKGLGTVLCVDAFKSLFNFAKDAVLAPMNDKQKANAMASTEQLWPTYGNTGNPYLLWDIIDKKIVDGRLITDNKAKLSLCAIVNVEYYFNETLMKKVTKMTNYNSFEFTISLMENCPTLNLIQEMTDSLKTFYFNYFLKAPPERTPKEYFTIDGSFYPLIEKDVIETYPEYILFKIETIEDLRSQCQSIRPQVPFGLSINIDGKIGKYVFQGMVINIPGHYYAIIFGQMIGNIVTFIIYNDSSKNEMKIPIVDNKINMNKIDNTDGIPIMIFYERVN